MAVSLGSKAKDKITGLTGIVIGRTEWLNGCVRLTIQPQEVKDGKPVDSYCVDEQQAEVLEENVLSIATNPPGGPMPSPRRLADAPACG